MKRPAQDYKPCKFFILRYVPSPIVEEFINIAVILIEEHGFTGVRFGDFERVIRLDPNADVEVLRALENEVRAKLENSTERELMLHTFLDSLSNTIQISGPTGCWTDEPTRELDLLADLYLR